MFSSRVCREGNHPEPSILDKNDFELSSKEMPKIDNNLREVPTLIHLTRLRNSAS